MHLLVTDVLACPRCGPEQGLIALADRVEDRRIPDGRLGCANCRGSYPIRGGVVALDPDRGADDPEPHPAFRGDPEEVALRIAALLGLTAAPRMALLVGVELAVASAVAARVEQVELIVQRRRPAPDERVPLRTSLLHASTRWPLRARSVHGVAMPFAASEARVRAAAGMVGTGGRLLACSADDAVAGALEAEGMRTLLVDGGVLVMERSAESARRLHQLD